MHELSIADALLDQITAIAAKHQLASVDEVEIETGFLRGVVPELMETAFREVTRGTLAEDAVLKIREVTAVAQCLHCRRTFQPEFDDFVCSACGRADVRILAGDEIILYSLSGPQLETIQDDPD